MSAIDDYIVRDGKWVSSTETESMLVMTVAEYIEFRKAIKPPKITFE